MMKELIYKKTRTSSEELEKMKEEYEKMKALKQDE
jgi:hypothetical protein